MSLKVPLQGGFRQLRLALALGVTAQNAEFVAHRIDEHYPSRLVRPASVRKFAGSQLQQSLEFLVTGAISRLQVQMHAVLDLLGVRNLDEQ